jgi:RNA polymerase sigma-70 factor (ECF subfamily)
VDHSRRRGYAKRGGNVVNVCLDDVFLAVESRGMDVVALDLALDALAAIDARKVRVVELRYFGGLSFEEVAEVLGVSPETAKRDWRMAKTWLLTQLTEKPDPPR